MRRILQRDPEQRPTPEQLAADEWLHIVRAAPELFIFFAWYFSCVCVAFFPLESCLFILLQIRIFTVFLLSLTRSLASLACPSQSPVEQLHLRARSLPLRHLSTPVLALPQVWELAREVMEANKVICVSCQERCSLRPGCVLFIFSFFFLPPKNNIYFRHSTFFPYISCHSFPPRCRRPMKSSSCSATTRDDRPSSCSC